MLHALPAYTKLINTLTKLKISVGVRKIMISVSYFWLTDIDIMSDSF